MCSTISGEVKSAQFIVKYLSPSHRRKIGRMPNKTLGVTGCWRIQVWPWWRKMPQPFKEIICLGMGRHAKKIGRLLTAAKYSLMVLCLTVLASEAGRMSQTGEKSLLIRQNWRKRFSPGVVGAICWPCYSPVSIAGTSFLRGSLAKAGWYRGCSPPGGRQSGSAYPETERERKQSHCKSPERDEP